MNACRILKRQEATPGASIGSALTSTMSKVFLDTNVLAYASDNGQAAKRARAIALLRAIGAGDVRPVISTQVMQEFYVVATRKLGIEPLIAKGLLHDFGHFEVIPIQPALINEAIDCSVLNTLSFWDALIIVSAEKAQCERLWTEDLNHGQVIRGVQIENPFRDA
jgi:predicted nucleic acid-binding protein